MLDCQAFGQSGTGMNKNASTGTQFSTGKRGPSPVAECSGSGLRYWMPEC
jgi:hypothetical protein